jgi:L-fuculose-phosphate aldolase
MSLKSELVYYSNLCYKCGFLSATDGNLSVRTKKESILVTPTNFCKGNIKLQHLIKVDLKGKKIVGKGKVSSEFKLHKYIYESRKDINAVVHTHPKFATAFAAAGIGLDKVIFPEMYLKFGKIPLAEYATPSTDEVPNSIKKYVKDHDAILLGNHGLVTMGKDLEQAYFNTEKVERLAEITFYARLLGGEKVLNKAQIKKLESLKK